MVKVNKGEIDVKGTSIELLADTATIIKVLHKIISEDIGEERSKELIRFIVELGFKSEEELKGGNQLMKTMLTNPKAIRDIIRDMEG